VLHIKYISLPFFLPPATSRYPLSRIDLLIIRSLNFNVTCREYLVMLKKCTISQRESYIHARNVVNAKYKNLTLKKRLFESKEKKRKKANWYFFLHFARNKLHTYRDTISKKEISLYFYSPRVYRVTWSVKTSRDILHPGSARAEKKMISTRARIADYWLATVEIMFRRSCLEFNNGRNCKLDTLNARRKYR